MIVPEILSISPVKIPQRNCRCENENEMLLLFYSLTVGKHGWFCIIKIHQPKLEIHLNHQKYLQLKYHAIWHKQIVDVKM